MNPHAVENLKMCVVQNSNEGATEIKKTVENEDSTVINQPTACLGNSLVETIRFAYDLLTK